MKIVGNDRGQNTVEYLIMLSCLFGFVGFVMKFVIVLTVIMGNFWFKDQSLLRKLQVKRPGIVQLLDTNRKIWRYSVITVKEGGATKEYYLDSNILFDYKLSPKN